MTPQFFATLRTIILRDLCGLRRGVYRMPAEGYLKSRQRDLVGLRAMRRAA